MAAMIRGDGRYAYRAGLVRAPETKCPQKVAILIQLHDEAVEGTCAAEHRTIAEAQCTLEGACDEHVIGFIRCDHRAPSHATKAAYPKRSAVRIELRNEGIENPLAHQRLPAKGDRVVKVAGEQHIPGPVHRDGRDNRSARRRWPGLLTLCHQSGLHTKMQRPH